MTILVTGGTGFIGSHTVIELQNAGYDVVVVDNLYNSKKVVLDRIETICGRRPKFYELDVQDREGMNRVFDENRIDAVIHFAGYKAVGESTRKPLEYYSNNLDTTLVLCDVMRKHGCKKIVFSSSATVYGKPAEIPITEECPLGETTNPYGTTKVFQERILTDLWKSDHETRADSSVRTRREFRTISFPMWHRSPPENSRRFTSLVTIMTLRTEQASAITSMSSISRRAMWRQSGEWRSSPVSTSSISGPESGIPSSTSSMPSKRHAEKHFRMSSIRDARAISMPAIPIRPRP